MPPDPGLAADPNTTDTWVKAVGNPPEWRDFLLCPQAENVFQSDTQKRNLLVILFLGLKEKNHYVNFN